MNLSNILKAKRQIKSLRKSKPYFDSIRRNPLINVTCAGGCGYSHRVRLSNLKRGTVFICDKKETRGQCREVVLKALDGRGVQFHHQQAGSMCGVTWRRKPVKAPAQPVILETTLGPAPSIHELMPRPPSWGSSVQPVKPKRPEPVSQPRAQGFLSRLLHFLRD